MTLPTGALSMQQIATELGLSLPLSLQHSWVRALAQVSGASCDFNSLRGKSGRFDGALAGSGNAVQLNNYTIFSGAMNDIFSQSGQTTLVFNTIPTWTGNFRIRNNSTGQAVVVTPTVGQPNQWAFNDGVTSIVRNGVSDSFTITVA